MRIKPLSMILTLVLMTSSCSSLRGSLVTGSLIGGSLGGMGGVVFSPNKTSKAGNALVFGAIGAGIGALLGHYFYSSDPENRDLKQMLLDNDNERGRKREVPLFDFNPDLKNIKPDVSFKPVKKYEVPLEKLPKDLEGKVKKQFLLEYETEGKTIQYEGRTIEIAPFKAWEHVYE
ncbi:hypothetical protein SHI21_19580 [Bacteriovorax sp. PP10]|uniref:Glycine zipper domain-containing protein n=1 Tax=Bacteriovorax antarcticus TaxID=3088717 RepID=A0ABU5VZF4_9BACT|nr:hypothetical protein [Bacteriovorax sp. PP10]MEA9358447.1 hypothetical protein [Bacteriovorax sp. PP10]